MPGSLLLQEALNEYEFYYFILKSRLKGNYNQNDSLIKIMVYIK